jgi:hypothetical protein
MSSKFTRLVLLFVLLVMVTSCGRTVYRAKYTKSNKYIRSKKRFHVWHAHGARPRAHYGGYW